MKSLSLFSLLSLLSMACAASASADALSSARAEAFLRVPTCGDVTWMDDQAIYVGLTEWKSMHPGRGTVKIYALNGEIHELGTEAGVTDIKISGDRIYVLTRSALEVWDLRSLARVRILPTAAGNEMGYHAWPHALVIQGRFAWIAHGTQGVTAVDLETAQVVASIPVPSDGSMDTDLAMDGGSNRLLVSVDNLTRESWRGILNLNLSTLKIDARTPLENPGIEHFHWIGDYAYLGFFNAIWKYSADAFIRGSSKDPGPQVLFSQTPDMENMEGRPFFDSENIYACMNHRGAGGRYSQKPAVIDRAKAKL